MSKYKRVEYEGAPFTLVLRHPAPPFPAPRMTRQDTWLNPPRPAVRNYREYCNALRRVFLEHPRLPKFMKPSNAAMIAMASNFHKGWQEYSKTLPVPEYVATYGFFPMPSSWSKKKQKAMYGTLHKSVPDRDNMDKSGMDALFAEDGAAAVGRQEKRWVWPSEAQTVIILNYGYYGNDSEHGKTCYIKGMDWEPGTPLNGLPGCVRIGN